MAHAVGLDQVGHVRLIQHSDPGYFRVVSYAHAAHAVVPGRRYLAGTSGSMAFSNEKTKLSIRWANKIFAPGFSTLEIWLLVIGCLNGN